MITKYGAQLTESEISQINKAFLRDFKMPFVLNDDVKIRLYFLLKNGEEVLAFGALGEVKPVIFMGESFVIYGVYDVVANVKGKGFGKEVVTALKNYLVSNDKTGLGFCMPKNAGFYKKCNFMIDTISTKRFVYTKGGKRITNQDGQFIFYLDSSEGFMARVLVNPEEEVSIPTDNLW